MNKKVVTSMLAVSLLASGLVGCAPKQETAGNKEGKITISIGEWPSENRPIEQEKWQGWVELMNEKYPDIEIQPDEWMYDMQTFLPKATSGQLPTLYPCHLTETKKIINAGYSADITETIEALGYAPYLNKQLMELCEKDGKYYGLPQGFYTQGLACNVELFRQAGLLDENGVPMFPQTWEELGETAGIIKEKTGQAGFVLPTINNCGGWHFLNIAWAYGTEFMKQDENGKWVATFNSPECIAALQFVKDLKWKYNALSDNALIDQQEMQKMFAVDQGGMYLTSGPDVFLTETYGMPVDRWSYTLIPAGPKGRFAQLGGKTWMFSTEATPEELDACFKWLDTAHGYRPALTEEEQAEYLEKQRADMKTRVEQGYIVYKGTTGVWDIPELDAQVAEIAKELANVDLKMVESSFDMSQVTIKPEEPMNCQDLYGVLDACIQAVLTDESADPAALIAEAQDNFQKNYLDKAQQQ
ncbi:MAG: ABC transporter substrate-binding protein [Ruminococcaceae bacterium]|nr:ABC transporter substrate-binding protein [Oscillospiraceae bacterium]